MLRKGRLGRTCKRCGKTFIPVGKIQYICKKCNMRDSKAFWDRLIKLQKQTKYHDNHNY